MFLLIRSAYFGSVARPTLLPNCRFLELFHPFANYFACDRDLAQDISEMRDHVSEWFSMAYRVVGIFSHLR
jgi:hypothetical protein